MDRRNRDRLTMTAFCRVAHAGNRRKRSWKRIENISGNGMLLVWSEAEAEAAVEPPPIGEAFTVELQLPAHEVFGQRAMQFQTKVVRAFRQANGRVMVGMESTRGRFKFIRPGTWATESDMPARVN